MATLINDENFEKETQKKIIIQFSSKGCGPCHIQRNIIEKNEYTMEVEYGYCDIDYSVSLASQNNIQTLPTLIVFENGKELKRKLGVQNINSLKELVG